MDRTYLRKKIFTTPNLITLFRFGIIFLLFWVWFTQKHFNNEVTRIAVVVFLYILGSLSDYVDGYWARLYQVKSKVGAFLDSLVDKFFTLSFFITYLYIDLIEVWWVWVWAIVIREVYITGIRIWSTLNHSVLVTEQHGKMKFAIQITYQSIIWFYFILYALTYESNSFQEYLVSQDYLGSPLMEIPLSIYTDFYERIWGVPVVIIGFFRYLPNILLAGVAGFTVYSGINYILKARHTRQA